MKICVPVRIGECRALLRQNLDSRFDFGMERHVGWVIGYFFSMSYHSGDEVGLYYFLVFHKAMGFLSGKKREHQCPFCCVQGIDRSGLPFVAVCGEFFNHLVCLGGKRSAHFGVLVFIFALHHISGRCNLLCLCFFAKGKKSAGKIERNPSQFVD